MSGGFLCGNYRRSGKNNGREEETIGAVFCR